MLSAKRIDEIGELGQRGVSRKEEYVVAIVELDGDVGYMASKCGHGGHEISNTLTDCVLDELA